MKRGSIHWAEDDKRRPVLIVSPSRRNDFARDVLIVPLSTSARPMSWHIELNRGEAGVPRACLILCERIAVLKKEFIEPEEVGALSPARMREVETAITSALGIQD
jgi:mRNA-degrading endonuclease toxin of MazEF toxin-antitoxin module